MNKSRNEFLAEIANLIDEYEQSHNVLVHFDATFPEGESRTYYSYNGESFTKTSDPISSCPYCNEELYI